MNRLTRGLLGFLVAACLTYVLLGVPIAAQEPTREPHAGAALLYIFSNSSPHVSVIDTTTNDVIHTADISDFTSWGWNDHNNYFDGEHLWLSLRDPDTQEAEVIALNLDTLEYAVRLPLGQEPITVYIGKPTSDGRLLVSKMGAGEVVVIDTVAQEILEVWDSVPTGGDVVCDADIAVDEEGVEGFYYPTRRGDTVVRLDPITGETLTIIDSPDGATPLMLTVAPDQTIWVQETDTNTNAVYAPTSLELLARFPTSTNPIDVSFTSDGQYGIIGHNAGTMITAVDLETFEPVATIDVGQTPQKTAIDPSGQYVYAILTREASVAVVDTHTWTVTANISLGTNPTGIFMRPLEPGET